MSKELHPDHDWIGYGHFADTVDVSEVPTHSRLLDAKGRPMKYQPRHVGFDLRPQARPEGRNQ